MARTKIFMPLVVALLFALLGGFMAYQWAQAQKTVPGVVRLAATDDVVNVAVAATDIPWATKLSADYIVMRGFLKKSLPPGYFTDPEALASRVLAMPVKQGDFILESRLAPTSITTGGVTAIITPGKRAIAVKGDKIVGLAGLIKPHDRVDVLVTIDNREAKQQITKLVLANILVLAAGSQTEKTKNGEKLPVDVYTLEVTPEEGEKLALASNEGKLQFALRSVIDAETVLTSGATVKDTLESYAKHSGKPEDKTFVMEIVRGGKQEEVRF